MLGSCRPHTFHLLRSPNINKLHAKLCRTKLNHQSHQFTGHGHGDKLKNTNHIHNDITSVHSSWETRNWVHQPQNFIGIWWLHSSPVISFQYATCNAKKKQTQMDLNDAVQKHVFMDTWKRENLPSPRIFAVKSVLRWQNDILSNWSLQRNQSNWSHDSSLISTQVRVCLKNVWCALDTNEINTTCRQILFCFRGTWR